MNEIQPSTSTSPRAKLLHGQNSPACVRKKGGKLEHSPRSCRGFKFIHRDEGFSQHPGPMFTQNPHFRPFRGQFLTGFPVNHLGRAWLLHNSALPIASWMLALVARILMLDPGVMPILGDLIEPGSTSGSRFPASQLSPRVWNVEATRIGVKCCMADPQRRCRPVGTDRRISALNDIKDAQRG